MSQPGRLDIAFTRATDYRSSVKFRSQPAGSTTATRLYGQGPPAATLGADGAFFIDAAADVYYGPKAAGVWPSGTPLDPIDQSALTFQAQMRISEDDGTAVDLDIDDTDAATGEIVISIPHAVTADLVRQYVWDLFTTDGGGLVDNPLYGDVTVRVNVTRP